MKKTLILTILLGTVVLLQAQSFQWAYHAGSVSGPDDEKVYRCLCDEHNNSYVLLYYSDIVNTPRLNNIPINLPTTGLNYNLSFLVLASYDCEGNLRWYRSIRCMQASFPGVEVSSSIVKNHVAMEMIDNHIFIAAAGTSKRLYLRDENGNDTLLTNSDIDNYSDVLIKLDTDGNLVWRNSVSCDLYPVTTGNRYACRPMCITHDDNNNIIVLSKIRPYTGIPPFPLVNNNLLYLLKFSQEGSLLSVKPFLFDSGRGVSNNWSQPHLHYYGGKYYFTGTTYFTDTIIVNENSVQIPVGSVSSVLYIACMDTNGYCERYKYLSPKSGDGVSNMDINEEGNIYITGGITGEYDGIPLNNPYGSGSTQIYLSKLDTLFNVVYIKLAWSSGGGVSRSLTLLSDNKIAIGGMMTGAIMTFDTIQFSFAGFDCFVAVFDEEAMQFIHALRIAGGDNENDKGVTALAADNQDNLIVCGSYRKPTLYVGDSVFHNYGKLDIFIGRYGWECGEEADWHSTGIEELFLPVGELKLYPNPVTSLLTLESKTVSMASVTVYNLLGQVQYSRTVNDYRCTIEVTGLVPGLYFIRVSYPCGYSKTLRFVKQE